jgi:DNA-binding transcriptional ArsR family regulator
MLAGMENLRPKRLTDPKELRAFAHPLRTRLLMELYARNEANATALADAIGEPVNKVSFHLRLLARYGFIVEAPERARDGRDRWWRPAYPDGIDWDELISSHPKLVAATHNQGMERALAQIRAFFSDANKQLPDWWQGKAFSHDWYLSLTPAEVTAFDQEYLDLCFRWRDRIAAKLAAGDSDPRASFAIFIYGFPLSFPPEESLDNG